MKKVFSISEFQSKSLRLLEEVARSGQSITVTKYGKPIARVLPIETEREKPKPDLLREFVLELGDITTPIGTKF